LDDPVERAAVDDQVFYDGEWRGPPRLDRDRVAVLERSHVQLAHSGRGQGAVWPAVDHQPARTADPFAAIAFECDRFFAAPRQIFVDDVEHLQEGHVVADLSGFVCDELPWRVRVLLPPDSQCQVQCCSCGNLCEP
jgi:hypothetical protein